MLSVPAHTGARSSSVIRSHPTLCAAPLSPVFLVVPFVSCVVARRAVSLRPLCTRFSVSSLSSRLRVPASAGSGHSRSLLALRCCVAHVHAPCSVHPSPRCLPLRPAPLPLLRCSPRPVSASSTCAATATCRLPVAPLSYPPVLASASHTAPYFGSPLRSCDVVARQALL